MLAKPATQLLSGDTTGHAQISEHEIDLVSLSFEQPQRFLA